MAFINEFISDSDAVAYDIAAISRHYLKSNYKPHWTIDRERNIYLREVASGRDEYVGDHTYTLYWKGNLIETELRQTSGKNNDNVAWREYFLLNIALPAHLGVSRSEILADLKEALAVRNGSGVYARGDQRQSIFNF